MCGISGIYYFNSSKRVDPKALKGMAISLNHRGPDSMDTYINESGTLGLAHNRLAIIDPHKRANQPFSDQYKDQYLIFNGMISNFKDFSFKDLKTDSDTEILFKLIKSYKNEVYKHLDGMYAFAFWNQREKTLTLARDHIGIKPLYYYATDEFIIFGSEIKAILTHPSVDKEVSVEFINQYFTFGYINSPNTPFKLIKQVQPGHYIQIDQSGIKEVAHTKFGFKKNIMRKSSGLNTEHSDLFEKTVKENTFSNTPYTSFLSGGIDSSSVAVALSKLKEPPILTHFSFKNIFFSEEAEAKLVTKQLGMSLDVYTEESSSLELLKTIAFHADDLICDPSMIPTYLLCQKTSKKYKMAISSDGGDELFMGYTTYLASTIKYYIPNSLQPFLANCCRLLSKYLPHQEKRYFLKDYLRRMSIGLRLTIPYSFPAWRTIIFNESKESLYEGKLKSFTKIDKFIFPRVFYKSSDSILEKASLFDLYTYLESDLLKKMDRMSMANSLEVRVPLLNKNYIEYALELPFSQKRIFLKSKIILKNYLSLNIGNIINRNKKTGFSPDLSSYLEFNEIKNEMHKTDENHELFNYINKDSFTHLISSQELINKNSKSIYAILNFKFWLDHFIQK